MQQRKRKLGLILGIVCMILVVGSTLATGTGRIYEYRQEVKKDVSVIQAPRYISGVRYTDLLRNPSADQLYSYANDNSAWTRELLEDFRESSSEVADIQEFTGDEILIVFIDFSTDTPYAAVFDLNMGHVQPGYEDTKTEIWADIVFIQDMLSRLDTFPEEEIVPYFSENYYGNWGIWVQQGPFDLMLTRETVRGFIVVGILVGGVYGSARLMKKGK